MVLRIVLAQLNLTVGDISNNTNKIIQAAIEARDQQADLIVFPELSITGYPPEDLLLRPSFIQDSQDALQKIMTEVQDIYCLIGHPFANQHGIFNACSMIYNGKIMGRYAKQYLPNYGVFDECRYFIPGDQTCVVKIKEIPVGLVICEDLWKEQPIQQAVAQGARLILSPNASPFESDKHEKRVEILAARARENQVAIIYVNTVSGQDELIFDGGSMVINPNGEICQLAEFFTEKKLMLDIKFENNQFQIPTHSFTIPNKEERIYAALVFSVKEYFKKNNIRGALIGVSGGIDSALTLAIAVDALGKDSVKAIIMPSRHTSTLSMDEANTITKNLDVETLTISIEPSYASMLETIAVDIPEEKLGITAQNLQARCRCLILMALSNSSGFLVLATSNRSELAVGYSTLYGDLSGGFAVLKDIPKTLVYKLAQYRNQISPIIPPATLTREPTAELAPNQKDEDSLPPYAVLDPILAAYLNQRLSIDEIIAKGFAAETVQQVVELIKKNEYKRYQAPLGPHINHQSFGKDWRYPIVNGYKG